GGSGASAAASARARATASPAPASGASRGVRLHAAAASANATSHVLRPPLFIARTRGYHRRVPTYSDRATGETYADAYAMIDAYLARFAERTGTPLRPLDEHGYALARRGSASIAVNVLEEHGVLLLLAPIM